MEGRTVANQLREICEESGIAFEEFMETWLGTKLGPSVPPRYRRLLQEVALALPEAWDDHAEWGVEVGSDENPRGYACALADEEGAGELVTMYTITIYPSLLDRLSDSACRWVFAHEFGHIASKLRQGSIVIKGRPYTKLEGDQYVEAPPKNVHEDAADQIAFGVGI